MRPPRRHHEWIGASHDRTDDACAEWSVTMTHSDTLTLTDGQAIEATGLRITVNGVTIAEFRRDQICSLRQYWDELTLLEQLGVAPHRYG